MTDTTRTAQPARTLQGPSLLKLLAEHGIQASSVTKNRRTGQFTVKFSAPNISNFYGKGTKPAREWAENIQEVLPLADIVDGFDAVADWRPGQPILYATVVLALPAQTKSATHQAAL